MCQPKGRAQKQVERGIQDTTPSKVHCGLGTLRGRVPAHAHAAVLGMQLDLAMSAEGGSIAVFHQHQARGCEFGTELVDAIENARSYTWRPGGRGPVG